MFGIRPIKTLGILLILFLIFSATRINHPFPSLNENNKSKPMSAYMEKTVLKTKQVKPKDGIKILNHLFKKKIKDSSMQCHLKKAKTRWFIACDNGNLIKNNYWEVAIRKNRLKLLARSSASLYIVKHYKFKELAQDDTKIEAKLEKALVKFFK